MKQGSLIAHLLIRSSLIRSDRSDKMSDCERFTQIAQDIWATVSKLLRSLMTNEWLWAIRSGRSFTHKNQAIRSNLFDYNRIF